MKDQFQDYKVSLSQRKLPNIKHTHHLNQNPAITDGALLLCIDASFNKNPLHQNFGYISYNFKVNSLKTRFSFNGNFLAIWEDKANLRISIK